MTMINGGDDSVPPRWEMLPFPCHHGCNCSLHQQTIYGSLVEEHRPDQLDNGEMAALVEAGEKAVDMLHGSRRRFIDGPLDTQRARSQAARAISRMERFQANRRLSAAERELRSLERDYDHYNQADKAPPRWYISWLTLLVLVIVVVFDAWYFQTLFSRLLRVEEDSPWKFLGMFIGGVIGVALLLAGYLLAGPIRDVRAHWRRSRTATKARSETSSREGEETVRRRFRLPGGVWPWLVGAFPVLAIAVFSYWAMLRFAVEVEDRTKETPGEGLLLFLLMALTLMGLEIINRNPYLERRKRLLKAYDREKAEAERLNEEAAQAVGDYEEKWRQMRGLRDEGLTMARKELGRAWSRIILPARLRHGRAGWESPEVRGASSAHVSTPSPGTNGSGPGGSPEADLPEAEMSAADLERLYQYFANIRQPVPGLGPLAEVVRSVPELDPTETRTRFDRAEQLMLWQYRRDEHQEEPQEESR